MTGRLKAFELESNNAKQTIAMLNGELQDQSIQADKYEELPYCLGGHSVLVVYQISNISDRARD